MFSTRSTGAGVVCVLCAVAGRLEHAVRVFDAWLNGARGSGVCGLAHHSGMCCGSWRHLDACSGRLGGPRRKQTTLAVAVHGTMVLSSQARRSSEHQRSTGKSCPVSPFIVLCHIQYGKRVTASSGPALLCSSLYNGLNATAVLCDTTLHDMQRPSSSHVECDTERIVVLEPPLPLCFHAVLILYPRRVSRAPRMWHLVRWYATTPQ